MHIGHDQHVSDACNGRTGGVGGGGGGCMRRTGGVSAAAVSTSDNFKKLIKENTIGGLGKKNGGVHQEL